MEGLPINFDGTFLMMIKIMQMILVPVFGVLTLVGIFLFLYSFKNPYKKRLAYMLTLISPIGFLFFLHGIVVIVSYIYNIPVEKDTGGEGMGIYVSWIEKWQGPLYEVFKLIIQPLLVAVMLIGVIITRHSANIPARERLSAWILIGAPCLWVLVLLGPTIYQIFIS